MKVTELITNSPQTTFSFEVLPPLKGNGIEKVFKTIDRLREFNPKYINITTASILKNSTYAFAGGLNKIIFN